MHTLGVLRPEDGRTASMIGAVRAQIVAMSAHRVITPDADVLGSAALLAGMLCPLQGYAQDAKFKAL